jgi:Zn-dependent protease with chaperone function/Zn-finger nucleic acid-binding protein
VSTTTDRPVRGTFEIAPENRRRLWALYAVLFAFVFVTTYIVGGGLPIALLTSFGVRQPSDLGSGQTVLFFVATWPGVLALVALAIAISAAYWRLSRRNARNRLVAALRAQPLDPSDTYHQRLANIVEEMRAASGAPPIECLVVPTVEMNAFAFTDFKNGACIGVTEGTLSRLSRPQLEGVVAHEVAHIVSGSSKTVTAACLLFAIYMTALDKARNFGSDDSVESVVDEYIDANPYAIGTTVFIRAVAAPLHGASKLVNAAISRTREQEADLAAARYTRDPVSLAEALRMISRHQGTERMTIPPSLAALCIRGSGSEITPWAGRPFATHPPTSERIDTLLSLANMSHERFAALTAEADKGFVGREHSATAPGVRMQADSALSSALTAAAAPVAAAAPLAASAAPVAAAAPPIAATGGAVANASSVAHPAAGAGHCPECAAVLQSVPYEGVSILVCRSCGGRLVGKAELARVIARREMGFTPEQERIADQVTVEGDERRRGSIKDRAIFRADPAKCPLCGETMTRRFYDYARAVAVDACEACGVTWFDKDELEVLQILIERTTG